MPFMLNQEPTRAAGWRRPLKRWGTRLVLLLLAWFALTAIRIYVYGHKPHAATGDTAIVLGAGVWEERPSPVFAERINHAIDLYETDRVTAIIFTGGIGQDDTQAESEVARRYAMGRGVPTDDIYIETASHITYQNLREAGRLVQRHNLGSALIVSDPLHMKRAVRMARDLGLEAYPSPTPTTRYRTWRTKLPFLLRETWFYTTYLLRKLIL
jgi:uncharacterized SAM-binding protein YcdF (DUF218 family)